MPAKQFDALVRFWGDKHRTKTYDIGADKRNTRIIPNKMIRHGWTTKGIAEQKSPLQSQSPFAKATLRIFLTSLITRAKQWLGRIWYEGL